MTWPLRTPISRCLGVLLALFLHCDPAHAAAPTEELKELRGRIESLRKQLADAEESRSEAADALKESEQAISDANRALRELGASQKDVNTTLAELQVRTRQGEDNLKTQQTLLGRLLYQQYLAVQPDPLKLILNREDPNQVAHQMYYYGYISRARADLLRELRDNLARLKVLSTQTLEKSVELAAIEAEQVAQRRKLQSEQNARKEVMSKISQTIRTQRREISTLTRDENRLARLVDQLSKMLASNKKPAGGVRSERVPEAGGDGKPFRELKGRLHLPVRGELGSRFGSPRSDGGLLWKGLLILAKAGQEVRAVASGRVVFSDWLRGFGNLLIVDHGDGYMSLYGNNETLFRRVGDPVKTGDAVASVGNSGGNAESGLYFEMRHQGRPFDPLAWVSLK